MTSPAPRKVWLGRDRDVAAFEVALGGLPEGRDGLFLVTGEAGIGMTRLADELARAAAACGVAVHWGRAWEAGGAPAYWPFTQVLRSICRKLDDAALRAAHLAELVPELGSRLSLPAGARR